MCGIAGALGRTIEPDREAAILAALAHRGPDGSGVQRGDGVWLAHTRLSILDLSPAGTQPMVDPETGAIIVFNGEIYNFRQLKSQFAGDYPFHSDSDTEVILALYRKMGTRCVELLEGMFAFAIWDPGERSLFLARDRFGIKPLHLWQDGSSLAFASEAKALVAMGCPARLDLGSVGAYLADGSLCHGSRTFFSGIEALAPGAATVWRDGVRRDWTYWSVATIVPQPVPADMEAWVWEGLLDSVRQHLVSDVEVGISLSAGLDSSILVALLAHAAPGRYQSFTFGFDEPEYDESGPVLNRTYPVELQRHVLKVRPADMLGLIDDAVGYFESPLGGLGTLSAFGLMRLSREQGVKVLLCGEGSDELFGGYKYHYHAYLRDIARSGDQALLSAELAEFNRNHGTAITIGDDAFAAMMRDESSAVLAPDGTSLGGRSFAGPALRDVGLAASVPLPEAGSQLRRSMTTDVLSRKLPKLLHFQDRASMAWGVETRVPFLDHLVWEQFAGLQPEVLFRGGITKALLRRLLARFGGMAQERDLKRYVATPQREWLKGPLRDEIVARVVDGKAVAQGIIDPEAWLQAYDRWRASPDLGNSFFVWQVVNLESLMGRCFS